METTLQNKELVKRFEEQVRENERLLHKVCHIYAYTAADRQDLFQEIVIQVWKAYPNFKGKARFSTWLYRVAINTAITGLRKSKNFITSCEPANLPIDVTDDNGTQADEQQLILLYACIEQLNPVEKAIVMLYMEDRSYEEMEEILGIASATLRVKMTRIKEKLRNLTKTPQYGIR